ncbi:ATP-binding protein [Amycolatopsis sp. NPDC004747]
MHNQGNTLDGEPQRVQNTITAHSVGTAAQVGIVAGDLHIHPGPPAPPIPRQLPAKPRQFVGRAGELERLDATMGDEPDSGATVVISAIGGTGGIGKTWLALHWAHRHLDSFPDGQLYVNLRGFDPSGEAMSTMGALRGFLDALGVDSAAIPRDLDSRSALYRSLLVGKRMLILLDNAVDTTQVRPLLPGGAPCTVLVTSRNHLPGLVTAHDARHLHLDVLTTDEAHALLVTRLGRDRVAADPAAAGEMTAFCGGLPLALSIVAGRAQVLAHVPLSSLAAELRELRLDALDENDPAASLPMALSWSYRALTSDLAEVFGLLGIAPGPDIGLPAVAGLTGLAPGKAKALLRKLEQASLLGQDAGGRYRMHDLVRLYAAERAADAVRGRDAALRRVTDFYLHTAYSGDRVLDPHRPPITLAPAVPGCRPRQLSDVAAALQWFKREHPCLVATQQLAIHHGWHAAVWQLAWAADTFQHRQAHVDDRVAMWQASLEAAGHLGVPAVEALVHRAVGDSRAVRNTDDEALAHLHHALALAGEIHDIPGQAHCQLALAWAWEMRRDFPRALQHAVDAARLFRAFDAPVWEARALAEMGLCRSEIGEREQARADCETALALHRNHEDLAGEAYTVEILGHIAHLDGADSQAVQHFLRAGALHRELGNTFVRVNVLHGLGRSYAALGDIGKAKTAWQEALEISQAQQRIQWIDTIRRHLDGLTGPSSRVIPAHPKAPDTGPGEQ